MKVIKKSKNRIMILRFVIYGFLGWCIEILWTGIGAALTGDRRFRGYTYLWMFPIYGSAVLLESLHDRIFHWPMLVRGGVWVFVIYSIEYVSGWFLRSSLGECPWDYSGAKYAVKGLIRLDYGPAWFAAGFIFERVHLFLDNIL